MKTALISVEVVTIHDGKMVKKHHTPSDTTRSGRDNKQSLAYRRTATAKSYHSQQPLRKPDSTL